MMNQRNRTKVQKIESIQKMKKVLEYRLKNATYNQISEATGISVPMVRKYLYRALKEMSLDVAEDAKEYRAMEMERLDLMAFPLWSKIQGQKAKLDSAGNVISPAIPAGDYNAIMAMCRIMELRARFVPGSMAPVVVEASGEGGGPVRCVVEVPARAKTAEEWAAIVAKDQAARKDAETKASQG